MHTNFIRAIFIFSSLFVSIIGLLLNYMESNLPTFITRTYFYGKFSRKVYQPLVSKVEVPKRWFKHFYVFAAPASSCILYLVIRKYFWNIDVPKNLIWMLNICLGSHRRPLVSAESTFIAALLITLHCWKRLYETHFVNIFSNKMMNISHYAIGFYHYIGTLICIIGESEGFFGDSDITFSWKRITYLQLLCTVIFLISSYTQFKVNFILRNLRKDEDDKINSTIYKIPCGGLFEYVSGALQITEIIIYLAMSIILWQSSTFHFVTIWVLANQISTAVFTHKWYMQTFQNYPKSRKILIPYLF